MDKTEYKEQLAKSMYKKPYNKLTPNQQYEVLYEMSFYYGNCINGDIVKLITNENWY